MTEQNQYISIRFRLIYILLSFYLSTTPCLSAEIHKNYNLVFILALSGEAASLGNAARNGAQLAYDSLPLEDREKVNLILEDDLIDPKRTVTIFNRLAAQNKIDALIVWSSGTAKAVAPLANQKKIPMIAIASDGDIPKGKNSVFNLWVTPAEEAKLLIAEVVKRGYKNIARVSTIQEGVVSCNNAFDAHKPESITFTIDEEFPPDVKNFQSVIAKIKSNPITDAIYLSLMPGQSGLFARQLKELNVSLPIFSFEILESQSDLKIAGDAFEGAFFATGSNGDPKIAKEFAEKFPDSLYVTAPQSYDAVKLLVQGLLHKERTGIAVADFLSDLKNYSGASGVFAATGDNRFTLPAMLKVVKTGRFVSLLE